MKRLLALIILMFLSLPVAAADVFSSGNKLLSDCESANASFLEGFCFGFVAGVADAANGKTWDGIAFCKPGEVTIGQTVKIVIKYLNDHPEYLHYAADSLAQRLGRYRRWRLVVALSAIITLGRHARADQIGHSVAALEVVHAFAQRDHAE